MIYKVYTHMSGLQCDGLASLAPCLRLSMMSLDDMPG